MSASESSGAVVPPVWVISLAASASRRQGVAKRLERLGIDFEFIEATDGAALTRAELAGCYDAEGAIASTGSQLTLGQIGTSLSHMALWRRMLDEGVEEAIILEDDAVPTAEFSAVVRNRHRLEQNWELLLMYYGPTRWSIWRQVRITRRSRSVRFVSEAAGAVGYLLKKSAAKKLLDAGEPIRVPVDYLTGGWVKTGVRRFGVLPHCVEHLDGCSTRSAELANVPVKPAGATGRHPDKPRSAFRLPERWSGFFKRVNPYFEFRD